MVRKVARGFGRRGFGDDPARYDAVRPAYPAALFDCLARECGLGPGCAILEVGPGTGIATRALLARRPASLLAIEPDERFAGYLRQTLTDEALRIEAVAFEAARLAEAGFDLAVAATSFHWVEQRAGLAKIFRALRPGGWWAMWWTHFGVATGDEFQAAIETLFYAAEARIGAGRVPFDLDRAARLRDLAAAGFTSVRAERWQAASQYDTAGLVGLYGTVSAVQAWPAARRAWFLGEVGRIAEERFGGRVERVFTTSLYIGRRGP